MKRVIYLFIAVLFLIPQFSYAEKIFCEKIKQRQVKRKIHPLEKVFNKVPDKISKSNKLLCLMVDFQKDDNPQTTGDGKFLLKDDDYPITLGKPPHDYDFFIKQLEALKYYYQAASFGALNLQYDLFPKPESGKTAYTLPHEMAYYNPVNASQELMISRFEEYFHDIFTQADKDDSIHFADYGHFLVIHAGSDWQHDIFGDSPSDIPSFFIKVSDDKKVWVDNHSLAIDHTCNVPEMITQDIQIYDTDNGKEIYGYGVINAVMAHEFGHSLGFIDLYSTTNYRPGVGFFDIMDSGGSGLLGIAQGDNLYYVEGGLPVLPSAWHRILAWEDNFRARGILKDIEELPWNTDITLNPAEKPVSSFTSNVPYFVKVPISDKEYFLLENRQIDPDGDGGTAVKSTSDKRVILYPIHYNDDPTDTLATYEYDFLLPGWITQSGRYVGGGILIWHIDDKIIFDEGNYEANTVNKDFYHRGVRLIEADNIKDIGNIHSRFWLGTQYEPYFKYKPVIQNGFFVGWNDNTSTNGEELGIFNTTFSATSKPPMQTNDEKSSIYSIYDISSYALGNMEERTMSFKFGINGFTRSDEIELPNKKISFCGSFTQNGYLGNEDYEFPIVTTSGLSIATYANREWLVFDVLPYNDISSITSIDYYDGSKKYLLKRKNKLNVFSLSQLDEFTYNDSITNNPLYITDTNEFIVTTKKNVFIGSDSLNYSNAECYFDASDIIIISNGELIFLDPVSHDVISSYQIPYYDENQSLVSFVDTLDSKNSASFIINKRNQLLKVTRDGISTIFNIHDYSSETPSLLSIFRSQNGLVYLAFGVGNKVFAVSLHGALLSKFPATITNYTILPYSPVKIMDFYDTFILLNTTDNYEIAIGDDGYVHNEISALFDTEFYKYDYCNENFIFMQTINSDKVVVSAKYEENNPIKWYADKNNSQTILYSVNKEESQSETKKLYAFAFPNPAKQDYIKFRVFNVDKELSISIFNSIGERTYKRNIIPTNENYMDVRVDIKKYSSGIYYAVLQSADKIKKIPFGIEK